MGFSYALYQTPPCSINSPTTTLNAYSSLVPRISEHVLLTLAKPGVVEPPRILQSSLDGLLSLIKKAVPPTTTITNSQRLLQHYIPLLLLLVER